MATDHDKDSAWIAWDGEAARVTIRRPRYDRDGLFIFGRRYAAQTVTFTAEELAAIRRGRTIAVDISGEYILYIRTDPLTIGCPPH